MIKKMQVPKRRPRARSRQVLSGGPGKSVIADSCEVLLLPPASDNPFPDSESIERCLDALDRPPSSVKGKPRKARGET